MEPDNISWQNFSVLSKWYDFGVNIIQVKYLNKTWNDSD